MLKKTVFFLAFCRMIAFCGPPGGVCALDLSLGGGALAGGTFTRYALEGSSSGGSDTVKSVQTMDRFDYGGFVFLDATYAEAAVSLLNGLGGYRETMDYNSKPMADDRGVGYETMLGLSLLGRYPLVLNEKWTVFPLLGAEFLVALVERRQSDEGGVYDRSTGSSPSDLDKNGNSYPLSAWNSLLIKIGAGVDHTLSRFLFLRGEFFYNLRLQTRYETGAVEMVKTMLGVSSPRLFGLTSGPSFRIALGRRFF
jgi:hypothetical protein